MITTSTEVIKGEAYITLHIDEDTNTVVTAAEAIELLHALQTNPFIINEMQEA